MGRGAATEDGSAILYGDARKRRTSPRIARRTWASENMREYLRLLGRECEDELRQELEARIREHHQEEPEPFTIQLAEDLMLMDSGRAIGTYYELVAEGGEYYLTGTSEISIPGKELLDDNWLLRVGEEIDARASGEG